MRIRALEGTIEGYGVSEIMRADKGEQFMGRRSQGILEKHGINVGERRYKDNILIGRQFQSYK